MPGLLLFENLLNNAELVLGVNHEQEGYHYLNLLDGRLDTAAKFDYLEFDLQQPDAAVGGSASALNLNSQGQVTSVDLNIDDKKPFGYWTGYRFALDNGSDESSIITSYDHKTNRITLETPLTNATNAVYSLILTPSFNAIAIAGHNLHAFGGANMFNVNIDNQSELSQSIPFDDILTGNVYMREFKGLESGRYVRFSIPNGLGEGFVSCLYIGQAITLGTSYNNFALRAPLPPPGMIQTQERIGASNNLNLPLPASYRPKPFDVPLDFKLIDPDILRAELARGMYEALTKHPFFLAWDTENHGHDSVYPEAAYCFNPEIGPPKLPDYNDLFDWRIDAKGYRA